jgi:hypothetical protein
LLGDEQRRFGEVVYVSDAPARFAVRFDRLWADGNWREQDRWYIFDGTWLAERFEDERRFTRHRVTPEGADPKEIDPLAMGQGPFVVPVAPKKERILARFEVSLLPAGQGVEDPPENSVRLRLTPRPNVDVPFDRVDLWYERDTLMPLRAATYDDEADSRSVLRLWDPKVNVPIEERLLSTEPPDEPNWEVHINE